MVEFELKDIYEKNNRLIVEVKIADKIESYGFPIGYKENHILTGKPQWLHKVKEYLERKYEVGRQERKTIYGTEKIIGTKYKTEEITDLSKKAFKIMRKEKQKDYDNILPDTRLKEEYDLVLLNQKKRRTEERKIRNDIRLAEFHKKKISKGGAECNQNGICTKDKTKTI